MYGDKFKLTGLPATLVDIDIPDQKMERYGLMKLPRQRDIVISHESMPSLRELRELALPVDAAAAIRAPTWLPQPINETRNDVLETQVEYHTPVYPKLSKVLPAAPQPLVPVVKLKEPTVVPIPSSIKFTSYRPNKTYRQTLLVKNKMKTRQRFQVTLDLPTGSSPYFSIEMVRAPSDKQGFVAPGMSCMYHVFFQPTTFADYHHKLLITSEFGEAFTVDMDATRQGPVLDLPQVLDCGISRAGIPAGARWTVTNRGGDGRFFILDSHAEEPACYERFTGAEMKPSVASIGPFEVYPSYFSLKMNESVDVLVKYHQSSTMDGMAENVAKLKLACDNHRIYEFDLKGKVEVANVSVGDSDECDLRACYSIDDNFIMDFEEQNPSCATEKTLKVRNNNNFPLRFEWNIGHQKFQAFSIYPDADTIAPKQLREFTVKFVPTLAKQYEAFAEFSVSSRRMSFDSPDKDTALEDFQSSFFSKSATLLQLSLKGRGVHPVIRHGPPFINLDSLYVGEEWIEYIQLDSDCISPQNTVYEVSGIDESVVAVNLSRSDQTIYPGEFTTVPIHISGILPGITKGHVICTVADNQDYVLKIPICVNVELNPADIQFGQSALDFGAVALGNKKSVKIPVVNNSEITMKWKIVAYSGQNVPADALTWKRQDDCDFNYPLIEHDDFVLFSDVFEGTMAPGESQEVEFTYIPTWYQVLDAVVECLIVIDGKEIPITSMPAIGSCQTPKVCIVNSFEDSELTCYRNTAHTLDISLENERDIPADVTWGYEILNDNSNYDFADHDVRIAFATPDDHEDNFGKLASRQVKRYQVEITSSKVGYFGLRLFCKVDGMVESNGLCNVSFEIKCLGLCVQMNLAETQSSDSSTESHSYEINSVSKLPTNSQHDLSIKFGSANLFEIKTRVLQICNKSGAKANFCIWPNEYTTTESPEQVDRAHGDPVGSFSQRSKERIHSLPLESIGFTTEHGKKYISAITKVRKKSKHIHTLLKERKGVGFQISPSTGVLEPYEELSVRVSCYNNLPKHYRDFLNLEFEGWMELQIPVSVDVSGCPLRVYGSQLSKSDDAEHDILDFSTRLVGSKEPVIKSFQLENQSPVDVQVELWVDSDLKEFKISPTTMHLASAQSKPVKIAFKSSKDGSFTAVTSFSASYTQSGEAISSIHSLVAMSGKTVVPKISCKSNEESSSFGLSHPIVLEKKRHSESFRYKGFLKNETPITLEFDVRMEPKGLRFSSNKERLVIAPREEMEFSVEFTAERMPDPGSMAIVHSNGDEQIFTVVASL